MARTILEGKVALVVGVETAPGRASAQQLSRAGCRMLLSGCDSDKAEDLGAQLIEKGGEPRDAILPPDQAEWRDFIIACRSEMGHIHLVLNAMALAYDGHGEAAIAEAIATSNAVDAHCLAAIAGKGPFRMLTLWPAEAGDPPAIRHPHWHGYVVLGPRQRLDSEHVPDLDAKGPQVLRAGAVGDAMVAMFLIPPSVRPGVIRLDAIPSSERKK